MRSLQDKVLGALEQIAVDAGLEAVQQRDWANTGSVYAQRGFSTVAKFSYDFQKNRGLILFNDAKHGPPGIDNYWFEPTDDTRINEMLVRWAALCGSKK